MEINHQKKQQAYRFITGKDDSEFCKRVAQALEDGYQLYGNPCHTYNEAEQIMFCAQAIVLPEFFKQ